MAPKPKQPAKVVEKPIEKPIERPISKNKKMKKKNYGKYSIYLYKLLKTVIEGRDVRLSKKCMLVLNNFVNDLVEKIAGEAGKLVAHGKKRTLSSWDVQSAVKLLLPGELAKHGNSEGTKAVTLYYNSKLQDEKNK